jgi:hypothetical protein
LSVLPADPLERCHRRWFYLWFGVFQTLEREEPRANRRLLAKLERHGLVGAEVYTHKGGARPIAQGEVTRKDPTDETLRRAAGFCEDMRPVKLIGQKRVRPPSGFMLMAYYGALAHYQTTPKTQRRGKSASCAAKSDVAETFNRTFDSTEKSLKAAMRDAPPAEKSWFKRNAKTLWDCYSDGLGKRERGT